MPLLRERLRRPAQLAGGCAQSPVNTQARQLLGGFLLLAGFCCLQGSVAAEMAGAPSILFLLLSFPVLLLLGS